MQQILGFACENSSNVLAICMRTPARMRVEKRADKRTANLTQLLGDKDKRLEQWRQEVDLDRALELGARCERVIDCLMVKPSLIHHACCPKVSMPAKPSRTRAASIS